MDRPLMAFYPGDELNDDPTNWWTPNVPALASMLGVSGFAGVVSRVQLYGGNRSVFHAVKVTDAEREKQARTGAPGPAHGRARLGVGPAEMPLARTFDPARRAIISTARDGYLDRLLPLERHPGIPAVPA